MTTDKLAKAVSEVIQPSTFAPGLQFSQSIERKSHRSSAELPMFSTITVKAVLAFAALSVGNAAHADVLAYFSFDDANGNYTESATINNTLGTPGITLTGGRRAAGQAGRSFSDDVLGINSEAGFGAAWRDIKVPGQDAEWVLTVDTSGYEDLALRWDYRPDPRTPPNDLDLEYSFDGTNWTRVIRNDDLSRVGWHSGSYDLSFVDAIEDQPQVFLKIEGLEDNNGNNSFVFDNVLLTGSRVADRPVSNYVGFSTYDVQGSSGSYAYTLLGLNVFQLDFIGRLSYVSGNRIGLDNSPANVDQYKATHFVEDARGNRADIVDTSGGDLVLSKDLSAAIAVGDEIRIRRHHTLTSVFGADNRFGFQEGATASFADEVRIHDTQSQQSHTYFYSSLTNRWARADDLFGDYNDQIIRPENGLIVSRKHSAELSFTLSGEIKTGPTVLPVEPGWNVLAHVYPDSVSLANTGLYTGDPATGMLGYPSIADADVLRLWDTDNHTSNSYYYVPLPPYLDAWANTQFENADDVQIPAGAAPMIDRRGSSGFEWNAQPPYDVPRVTPTLLEMADGGVGTSVGLSWASVAQGTYQLQSSHDLDSWTDVGSAVMGNGNPVDMTVLSDQFFRLQVPQVFWGAGDASAAVSIADRYLVVADDEDNVLRVYEADFPGAPLASVNLLDYGFPTEEMDLEGATTLYSRTFWIGSHGRSKDGTVRAERSSLFATHAHSLGPSGSSYANLRSDLVNYDSIFGLGLALSIGDNDPDPNLAPTIDGLNIEGLSRSADHSALYIGFRNPLVAGPNNPNGPRDHALIVPLTNPDEVVDSGQTPSFGNPIRLNLGDRGIRSIEYSPTDQQYFISAGSKDGADFALFTWSGNQADAPVLLVPETAEVQGMYPEALVVHDRGEIQLLSDDGRVWSEDGIVTNGQGTQNKDLNDATSRRFRAMWLAQ